jgi:hypothetical protein
LVEIWKEGILLKLKTIISKPSFVDRFKKHWLIEFEFKISPIDPDQSLT